MQREDFLDFVRCFPLSETLSGKVTPDLTEFGYARVYSSELNEWFEVPGNSFIIMFSATNSFCISIPTRGYVDFKYCFDSKNKKHIKFLLNFLDREILQSVKYVGSECLKLTSDYDIIKNIMILIKTKEEMYSEMDCVINKMFLC